VEKNLICIKSLYDPGIIQIEKIMGKFSQPIRVYYTVILSWSVFISYVFILLLLFFQPTYRWTQEKTMESLWHLFWLYFALESEEIYCVGDSFVSWLHMSTKFVKRWNRKYCVFLSLAFFILNINVIISIIKLKKWKGWKLNRVFGYSRKIVKFKNHIMLRR
jgi:hypothetical protein